MKRRPIRVRFNQSYLCSVHWRSPARIQALAFAQTLTEGIYVAMHGRCFPWNNVIKNSHLGILEPRRSRNGTATPQGPRVLQGGPSPAPRCRRRLRRPGVCALRTEVNQWRADSFRWQTVSAAWANSAGPWYKRQSLSFLQCNGPESRSLRKIFHAASAVSFSIWLRLCRAGPLVPFRGPLGFGSAQHDEVLLLDPP